MLTLVSFVSLACSMQLTLTDPTGIPATLIVETAFSTDIPATALPTQAPPTIQPPSNVGTTVTYGVMTLTIPQQVASGASSIEIPRADGEDISWSQRTPGHLQIMLGDYYILQGKTHQPNIYVYPAQDYAELVPAAFESVRRIDNIIYSSGAPISADQLPTVPFINAQEVFTSNIQVISFQNGSGVRFLTEYAQYPASANNQDLFYQFQGVTRDGAYYIIAIFPVSVPVLAETSAAGAVLPDGGIPYPYMADPNADMTIYYNDVTNLLNAQSPDAFTPSLPQLDALIQSMQVNP